MARFTSRFTLVLGLCAAVTLALVEQLDGIVSLSTIPGEHVIDIDSQELLCQWSIPKVFIPTTTRWRVRQGQEILAGLHVKFEYIRYQKYASLVDNKDAKTPATIHLIQAYGSNNDKNSVHCLSLESTDHGQLEESSRVKLQDPSDSIVDFPKLEDTDPRRPQRPKHIVPMSAEQRFFLDQLEIVKNSSDHEAILGALEELQDLAGDMAFGLQLSTIQKLNILASRLCCGGKTDIDCDKTRLIRSKVALVIGTAVQNHRNAQITAFNVNLHGFLMDRLETEPDQQVLRNLIFAYGSLVRGGHNRFIRDKDIVRLAKLYKESTDPEFRRKCVYIMSDFVDPDMQFVSPEPYVEPEYSSYTVVTWFGFTIQGNGVKEIENGKEKEKEKEKGNVTQPTTVERMEVDVGPWCEILRQETKMNNEDREIIEHAIELLHASYPETCLR